MARAARHDARRYRRRILAIGVVLLGLLYVVMAPMYVSSIENDLEERVPDELDRAGFVGIQASFDGQDGTLWCERPLSDPEAARQAAYDVWGVRAVELDRSCRVLSTGHSDDVDETVPTDADESRDTAASTSDIAVTTATTLLLTPAYPTVAAAVRGNPQLSLFNVLIQEAGMSASLADVGADPFTLFAPSDDAFDALPADELAQLRADPDALRAVIDHHITLAPVFVDDLASGSLEMANGTTVAIESSGDSVSIDGAMIVEADIDATNGVVHIVDAVLVPDDFEVSEAAATAEVEALYDGASIALTGTVGSGAVRDALADAAAGPGITVVDELAVDADTGLSGELADDLVSLVAAMGDHLVNGSVGFDGETLRLVGTYPTEADRDAIVELSESIGIEPSLSAPPEATDDDATALEDELNDYVRDHPIRFAANSFVIEDESGEVLDRIASLAQQFDGVAITVQGHTDSDGIPESNLTLSRMRAQAVRDALVARGLAGSDITFEGFGSEHPILVDGEEDKGASRRVEFVVETTS